MDSHPNSDVVCRLQMAVAGEREGEAGGMTYWSGQFTSAALTWPQTVGTFWNSAEFSNRLATGQGGEPRICQ